MMYAAPEQVVAAWAWLTGPAAIGGLSVAVAVAAVIVAVWPSWMDRLFDHVDEVRSIGLCAWIDWYISLPVSDWLTRRFRRVVAALDGWMPDSERRHCRIRALIVHGLCTIRREESRKRHGEEAEEL